MVLLNSRGSGQAHIVLFIILLWDPHFRRVISRLIFIWGSEHSVEEASHLEAVRLGKPRQRKHGNAHTLQTPRLPAIREKAQFAIVPPGGN